MDWPFRGCFGAIDAAADECINKRAEPDRAPLLSALVFYFSASEKMKVTRRKTAPTNSSSAVGSLLFFDSEEMALDGWRGGENGLRGRRG